MTWCMWVRRLDQPGDWCKVADSVSKFALEEDLVHYCQANDGYDGVVLPRGTEPVERRDEQ